MGGQVAECGVDKLQLYSDMLKLPQHMGGQVAEIIRAREPGHSVPDLVEIDFDILKPSTLAALQSLVVSRKRQVAEVHQLLAHAVRGNSAVGQTLVGYSLNSARL